ncbi:MAG: hypothetical protein EBU84_19560, partial [Actinobacteria bacterium]|nr:hypothetical protein [Actinomycetota bacterium]
PYKNINDTLQYMRVQIAAGIPWTQENAPQFDNAATAFYWLLDRVQYKHDPPDTELLQSIDTLLTSRNFWGIPGAGDCDCFVIAWLTLFNCSNINGRPWIKLAGRSKQYPVHIWAGVDVNGRELTADLTERKFNKERAYPHTQKIYFKPL